MSKVTPKRLPELAMIEAIATPAEVRALVLELKGARVMIERFMAAKIPSEHRTCVCAGARSERAPARAPVVGVTATLN